MTDAKASPGNTRENTRNFEGRRRPTATPTMEGPAIYRICVEGTIASEWINRLAGMTISPSEDTGRTILLGRLNDQAALAGVLATLYELHLPVSSAECLEAD